MRKKRKKEEANFEKKNMWGMEEKKHAGNGKKQKIQKQKNKTNEKSYSTFFMHLEY